MTPTTRLRQDLPREVRRQETTRLFELAATATGEERDRLIDEVIIINTSVARTIAKRYANRGVPLEDLEQVAYLALVRAARKFDGELAEDFLVFAVPTIRGEIKRWFRDHGWTVRPPRRVQELQSEVLRVREAGEGADGSLPSPAEIAERLDVEESAVTEALAAKGCFSPMSLDMPVDPDGEGAALADLLPSSDDGLNRSETRLMLEQAIGRLTPREQLIVRLRFVEDLTQAEIGERIGVTQMQVSRLLAKVIARLRTMLTENGMAAA